MNSSTIKAIQDIMRQDAGVDGDAQRISQLVWMIFLKVFDDKEAEWEIENESYKSEFLRNTDGEIGQQTRKALLEMNFLILLVKCSKL